MQPLSEKYLDIVNMKYPYLSIKYEISVFKY